MDMHQPSATESSSTTDPRDDAKHQNGSKQENQGVMETASAVTSTIKDTASQMANAAKGTMLDIAGEAQAGATEMAEEVKTSTEAKVSEQRIQLSKQLDSLARVLRETGDRLQDEDNQAVAQYTNVAADQVQRFAGYLQESDTSVILGDLGDLARRQPGIFLASALTAGLLIGRFLKSSSQRSMVQRSRSGSEDGYNRYEYRTYAGPSTSHWSRGQSGGYQAAPSGTEFGTQPVSASTQQNWTSLGDSQVYQYAPVPGHERD